MSISSLLFLGTLFSFQVKSHSVKISNVQKSVKYLCPVEEERPRIKIKIQVGLPDVANLGCTGDNPCGPCPGLCVKVTRGSISQNLSGFAGVEVLGEDIDSTHFKIIFDNVLSPQIVSGGSVTFSESIMLDGQLISDVFNKVSINLISGTYPIVNNGDGTSYLVMNSVSL